MNNLLPVQLYADIKSIMYGNQFTTKQLETIKEKTIVLVCELLWYIIHNGDIMNYQEISYKWMLKLSHNDFFLRLGFIIFSMKRNQTEEIRESVIEQIKIKI
jgi:hypothetical protein